MSCVQITGSGMYLPEEKISNIKIEKELNLEEGYIEKRTGIKTRYYAKEESIEEMAIKAVEDLFSKEINKENIELIIVATTSSKNLMPGISNMIQKQLKLNTCICLDILAGCSRIYKCI